MVEQLTYLTSWIIEALAACKIATLQYCNNARLQDSEIPRVQDCKISVEYELIGNFD